MVRPMSLDRVNDVSHLALDCADGELIWHVYLAIYLASDRADSATCKRGIKRDFSPK